LPFDIECRELAARDRTPAHPVEVHDDGVDIRDRAHFETGDVMAVCIPMERRIDVRTRVRDHRDAADLKLGARRVERARIDAAQMIADQWRGQALVRDHAVFDRVAEVD